jgi:hypothetical protein
MSSSLGDDGRYLFQGPHDRENRAACLPRPRSQRAIHVREARNPTTPRSLLWDVVQWPLAERYQCSRWSLRLGA